MTPHCLWCYIPMKVLKLKDFDIQDWLDTPFQEDAYLPDFLMKMVFLHHRFLNHNNLYPLAIVFFFLGCYYQMIIDKTTLKLMFRFRIENRAKCQFCPCADSSTAHSLMAPLGWRCITWWKPAIGIQDFYTRMRCLQFTCFPLLLSPPFLLAASVPSVSLSSLHFLFESWTKGMSDWSRRYWKWAKNHYSEGHWRWGNVECGLVKFVFL